MADKFDWLALAIGNSRLHWAWFTGDKLQAAWNTPHLSAHAVQQLARCQVIADFPAKLFLSLSPLLSCPIYLASVVESQTTLWKAYPDVRIITLEQIPLRGVYSTLGIDRALALWGAGDWGFPVLVLDAGTALTFTGADRDRVLVGGAILPGLGLQLQSLAQKTANLPQVEAQNVLSLPPRWALNTPESIQSGVIYTITAGIRDFIAAWWQQFPESYVVLTGGDGKLLLGYLRSRFPEIASKIILEPNLIFWGMRAIVRN